MGVIEKAAEITTANDRRISFRQVAYMHVDIADTGAIFKSHSLSFAMRRSLAVLFYDEVIP